MMKLFFLAFAFFSAHAKTPKSDLSLSCTNVMPTSSFSMQSSGDDVIVKLVHHNGTDYMPIHEGIIVPRDFPFLKDRASLLIPLGTEVEFKFPRKKCQVFGAGLVRCSGGQRKTVNGIDYDALSFYTSKIREETMGISFETWKVSLDLNAVGHPPVMTIAMNYSPDECKFGF